ncbi:MAG: M48 family metallopeptidase [Cyanobacteria bacterium SZAS-4]|nr:M48 family metallopeptidase [Cyanobacteria bacterium SZAS-4]
MAHSDSTTVPPEFKEPKASVPRLVALALLGYVYIFALMLALLVAALAIVFFMIKFHYVWFAKFAFLLVITAGLMVKALFVRFPQPVGLVIEPKYAPRLEELIADLRSKTGCPKIHSILLNGEFNCGITQIPRLGILGWHKNVLLLGLPLLDAVSIDEFKAILAHEMGHISGKHGVISCWIYQVQKSWDQLYEILRAEKCAREFSSSNICQLV